MATTWTSNTGLSAGAKHWYNNQGALHRIGGPAVEYPAGHKQWYKDGECHREDGPAVVMANGDKRWYLNSKEYTHAQYIEWQKVQALTKQASKEANINTDF